MIKIFDSAAHVTTTGKWRLKKDGTELNSSCKKLIKEIKDNNYYKACVIGLDSFENYNHKKFIKICKNYKQLVLFAGVNPNKTKKILKKELINIKKLGFRGIKLHPRLSSFYLDHNNLPFILKECERLNLVLMLCCYNTIGFNKFSNQDFLVLLNKMFRKINRLKTILMHGGCTRILEFSEFVKLRPDNFLLDLSMTLMRYSGSSIDMDIKYLFKTFDEKICIGSDFPEYSLKDTKKKFLQLSKGLNTKKINNISYKNLENFLK
jgi:predicted TIM-barrel fold metal-dependent hydrolase